MSKMGNHAIALQESGRCPTCGEPLGPRCAACSDADFDHRQADRLAAADPTTLPGHDWATDREYRAHVGATTRPADPDHHERDC